MFLGFCSWLFEGVGRQKAEELLSLPGNRVGSFMVRESSRERGKYQEAASASPDAPLGPTPQNTAKRSQPKCSELQRLLKSHD